MERGPLEVVVGVDVGAARQQELARVDVAIGGGDHQRRLEVLVAHVDGHAALECVQQCVQVAAMRRHAHVHERLVRMSEVPGRVVLERMLGRLVAVEAVRVREMDVLS